MRSLTILQTNDLHGYIEPHPELFSLLDPAAFTSGGGLARIATVFRTTRRDRDDAVIALDNGDTLHGTMPAVQTRGGALLAPLRALGLDAMTAHWEFAYGLSRVRELADQLSYPILAANCRSTAGEAPLPPFIVIERAGLRVGVIGLAAVVATSLLPAGDRGRLELTIGDAELRSLIPSLRRDHAADVIVVLSHLGFPQDCKLAALVPGIDVLLSGHTHNRLEVPAIVNDTIVMQSGAHGSFVGRLDLEVAADGVAGWTHALVPVDDRCEPDAAVEAIVRTSLAPFAAARANVIADAGSALHRYAMLESTMDNLLLDAVADAAGTPVALSNGWRYGAPIPPGPLTELDLWNIVPANPAVSVVRLTGVQLRQLFEDNLESTFACDPWQQRGGYVKRCRGIEMTVKLENPRGQRIQELRAGGDRVREGTEVAAGFLGRQAVPDGVGSDRRSLGLSAVDALERYLRSQKTVTPALRGPIRVV